MGDDEITRVPQAAHFIQQATKAIDIGVVQRRIDFIQHANGRRIDQEHGEYQRDGRLYQIEAKMLPGGDDTDVIRFQQSLIFTDKGSNRPQDTIKEIREACHGVVNNPAGLDDPRCQKR